MEPTDAIAEIFKPRPIAEAPHDGRTLFLHVIPCRECLSGNPLEDVEPGTPVWTIGWNAEDDTGEDKWEIAGWSWEHDCFWPGHGEPVAFIDMWHLLPTTTP